MERSRPRLGQRNVIIIPIRETKEWWEKSVLDRSATATALV